MPATLPGARMGDAGRNRVVCADWLLGWAATAQCLTWLCAQALQRGPMRAEDLFREWYRLGEVRAGTAKFWDHQLAVGQRFVSAIHLEVLPTAPGLAARFHCCLIPRH